MRYTFPIVLAIAFLPICAAYAGTEGGSPLQGRADTSLKLGTQRGILSSEIWAPIRQQPDAVFYGDLRFMGDDKDNREGNIGLGYRQIMNDQYVLGGHVWVDRRYTSLNSTFYQTAAGLEVLGKVWDFRLNGYLPFNNQRVHETPVKGSATPYFSGSGIYTNTTGTTIEETQPGFDFELGIRVPEFTDKIDTVRVYAGSYNFYGDQTDDVHGVRTRIVADVNPWLQLGGRIQHDDERGTQSMFELTLRMPTKKMYRKEGLRARLDESPERDIDIITSDKVTDTGQGIVVLNNETGAAQKVVHVNNTGAAGGDGTYEKPYDSLAAAEAGAASNNIIYVHTGDGLSTNQSSGISLAHDNMWLIGAGTNFSYDPSLFRLQNGKNPLEYVIAPSTGAPSITNSNLNGDAISIGANNIIVSGFSIDGAARNSVNISADGVSYDNISIQNVNSINSAMSGLYVDALNGGSVSNLVVQDSSFNAGGNNGIMLSPNTNGTISNVTIKDTSMSNNADSGLYVSAYDNGVLGGNILFSGNTIDMNSDMGIYVTMNTDTILGDILLDSNSITNSGQQGVYFSLDDTETSSLALVDNTVSDSGFSGIHIAATGETTITAISVESNIVDSNGRNGVYLFVNSGAVIDGVTISDNTITNHNIGSSAADTVGVYISANSTMLISHVNEILISRNVIDASKDEGIYVYANNGTVMENIRIDNNDITNNTQDGIYVRANNGSRMEGVVDITNNRLDQNQDLGIQVVVEAASYLDDLTIDNNQIEHSDEQGLYIYARANSDIDQIALSNNVISTSLLQGAYINALASRIAILDIIDNEFSGNTGAGLHIRAFSNATAPNIGMATIRSNLFDANSADGLYIVSGSAGALNALVEQNSATNNTGYGINIDRDSSGAFAVDLGGGEFSSVGLNRVYDNVTNDIYADLLISGVSGTLYAQNNFWNDAAGLMRYSVDGATVINATPYLAIDPQ